MVTQGRQSLIARVANIVGSFPFFSGENEVGDSQIEEAFIQTLNILSRDRPRIRVQDVVGDDGKYYALSTLTSWENDFSEILSIDYDAGSRIGDDARPQHLIEDDEEWVYYRDATVRYFYLPYRAPSSSVTMRITYTARHTLNGTSTVPQQLEEAVIYKTIELLARTVQIHAEKALDPPAGAQFVTMRNKGSGFASIADTYQKLYVRELGGEDIVAASAMRETDQVYLTGEHYIFHSGSRR